MAKRFRTLALLIACYFAVCGLAIPQTASTWRAASADELASVLPARAPVEKERIETEMRTASGIINQRGQMIASVVLITAGYAADGKYSHYFLAQAPVTIGAHLALAPGAYAVGWSRAEQGLTVRFFDAISGQERGAEPARRSTGPGRVESFRILPPNQGSFIQIGRFVLPYKPGN